MEIQRLPSDAIMKLARAVDMVEDWHYAGICAAEILSMPEGSAERAARVQAFLEQAASKGITEADAAEHRAALDAVRAQQRAARRNTEGGATC